MNRDKVFEDLIQTIERNAVNNVATISNVDLWAKSWREEFRQYNVAGRSEQLVCECKDEWIEHIDNFSDRMQCKKCGKSF